MFRQPDGRFVPRLARDAQPGQKSVEGEREAVRGVSRSRVERLTQDRIAGKTSTVEWQLAVKDEIKAMHLLEAAIAKGGKAQLTPSDLGRIGALTREQYKRLANFAREVDSGKQKLNGRMLNRALMYVDASRATYDATERRMYQGAGVTRARRVWHTSERCPGCEANGVAPGSKGGWRPVDELPPIGSQQCLTNCKCTIEYKTA